MNQALTLKLWQKGLILVLVPLAFGLTNFAFMYGALSDAEVTALKQKQARILSEKTSELSRDEFDTARNLYDFYKQYSADEFHRNEQEQKFEAALNKMRRQFTTIHSEMVGAPKEEDLALSHMEHRILAPFIVAEDQEHSGQRNRMQLALLMMTAVKLSPKIARDIGILTTHFIEKEEAAFQLQVQHRRELKQWIQFATLISIFLSLGLYVRFNRDTTSRLARLLDNTARFARKQTLHPALQGDDEISQLDKTFREMAQSITAAANDKQEFMAMLARDLRFPIDSINQSLQQLSEGRLAQGVSSKAAEIIKRCRDSSTTLMRLVDDLLDVESAESGKLQMNFQQVSIDSVLDKAVKTLHGLAEAKSIKFIVPTTQMNVYADGDRLVQVLINLLANAVKFSPDASSITVEIVESDPWLVVRVIDNGPGISSKEQTHVFERFHQVGSSDRRVSGGTGLGLTICKEIIDAHHGTIGVESSEGHGCTFWVKVPMTQTAMNARTGTDVPTSVKDPLQQQLEQQAGKRSPFSLKLTHKGLILLGVPLMFGITCLGSLYGAITHAETIARDQALAKSLNDHRTMLFQRTLEASSAFMDRTTDRQAAAKTAVQGMHAELHALHGLMVNDHAQIEMLHRFESAVMEPFDRLDQAAQSATENMSELAGDSFSFDYFQPFLAPYRQMAESSYQTQSANTRMLKVGLLGAMALNILLSMGLYLLFTRDTSSRLENVLDNTRRFARGESLNPPLAGSDEIAQLDRVFHAMTEAISRAASEKREFMEMIAHDIRSPLTSMSTSLLLLSDQRMAVGLSDEAQGTVETCLESSERVLQLVNDLLDMEKLDAGKLQLQFEELPIAYVLETASRAVRDLADKKQVKLSVPNSDSEVFGDPKRLVQVLVNLLIGAVENAPEGSSVTVELEDEPEWLLLRVNDRIDSKNSARAGIGSSICNHIVTAHHGTMGVEETDGERRVLWFRLPKTRNTITLSEKSPQPAFGETAL